MLDTIIAVLVTGLVVVVLAYAHRFVLDAVLSVYAWFRDKLTH